MKAIDQLRKLISQDTHTISEIAAKTGLNRIPLYSFRLGKRSLPDDQLDALAAFYGCEIVLRPSGKRRKG